MKIPLTKNTLCFVPITCQRIYNFFKVVLRKDQLNCSTSNWLLWFDSSSDCKFLEAGQFFGSAISGGLSQALCSAFRSNRAVLAGCREASCRVESSPGEYDTWSIRRGLCVCVYCGCIRAVDSLLLDSVTCGMWLHLGIGWVHRECSICLLHEFSLEVSLI